MISFDLAMTYLLVDEGTSYTNNPKDPGGPTKFGITLSSYQNFLNRLVTAAEIQALTLELAKEFYLAEYWQPVCPRIVSAGVAICFFDSSVLYGLGTAARLAQSAVNRLTPASLQLDGIFGDKSIELLNETDEEDFLNTFHDLVCDRIDGVIGKNQSLEVFRKGWTARADRLLTLTDLTSLIEQSTKQQEGS